MLFSFIEEHRQPWEAFGKFSTSDVHRQVSVIINHRGEDCDHLHFIVPQKNETHVIGLGLELIIFSVNQII